MSFWGELKRRKLVQVTAVYAVVAWLLVQIVATVETPLSLPDWFDTAVIVLLLVGFPITLIVSWAFNLTPEGLVKDESAGSAPPQNRRRIEYALIGLLAVAIAWIGYRELAPSRDASSSELASSETALPQQTNSVAVLPFQNLSLDPENAFFAAGIHEEVLNQLAKLSNLSVTSRTSVLRFENTNLPIPEIAAQLNVRNVLEGSVRYADQRVRIAAQLIDAETDEHLWSEIYEREMADIFAIQADIAVSIADSLAAEFSLEEQAELEVVPTDSIEAYELFLASVAEYRPLRPWDYERSLGLVEGALAIDPSFASAWAHKAELHLANTLTTPAGEVADLLSLAEQAAQRAVELDPGLDVARVALSRTASWVGDWRTAETQFRQVDLRGAHASRYAQFLITVGKAVEARPYVALAKANDPLNPINTVFSAGALSIGGETEAALAELERGAELFGDADGRWAAGLVGQIPDDLAEGRLDSWRSWVAENPDPPDFDNPDALLQRARSNVEQGIGSFVGLTIDAYSAAWLGAPELALDAMDEAIAAVATASWNLWRPVLSEMRALPGFKEMVRRHGFVDYWREYGWPDLCRPLAGQDFECF